MDVIKKVRKVLKETFPPPARVSLEDDSGIIGMVIWPGFRGLDSIDRQNLIWDALEKELSREERQRIVIILAVTPEEEKSHRTSHSSS